MARNKITAPVLPADVSGKRVIVTAADVRTWAAKHMPEVTLGARGKLPQEVIDAYNAGRKNTYGRSMTQTNRVMTIKGRRSDASGRVRTVTYKVAPSELRAWANSKEATGKRGGFGLGERGRIPANVIEAFGTRELVSK